MKALWNVVAPFCVSLLIAGTAVAASAPLINSISPNPLISGSSPTVTIQGTGFQPGALVYQSYGTNSMIQYGASSVTSTSVTVAIYQGPASSSSFCVKNPGSVCSNSLTVPVTSNAPPTPSAPALTSVSPNPLTVGSYTVSIQGSGFQSGALVYQSYGSNSMIQIQPSSVTSTLIKVGIYQGPAASASFCVKNPGTSCSDSITLPVGSSTPPAGPPVLTSVSPNPLPTGKVTVTIQGSGFLSGAVVTYASAGSTTQVQPSAITSTSVTIGITQAAATSSTFCVQNPGTSCSNSITVPVSSTTPPPNVPVLTSVSPNPLPTGKVTVTIQGSGFLSGAVVTYASAGSTIQVQPSAITSTSVMIGITQAAATSSTFCVQNPGTSCSNSITVPVSSTTPPPNVPVLTSVSPNPLPTGKVTVTIQGSGFLSGAVVTYASAGSTIQVQPSAITSTSVTIGITQAAATSSTFCVQNPGTSCSNSITVPVSSSTPPPSVPVLTSVSPNPLPTGNQTVTLRGSGFVTGAVVTYSSGSSSGVQVQPASLTAASITIAITQASAVNATFAVTNPGSSASNSITVPVTVGSPATYTLTVVNGTITNPSATSPYSSGTVVSITANTPPAGEYFQNWTGAAVTNSTASSTTLTMPSANTTVTANFAAATSIPFPVSSHPRLWITTADLPRLASWANAGNVAYQGMGGVLGQAVANYKLAFPGAALTAGNPAPASPYPDFGDTQGYTGILSEENGVILAFNSLIDPSPANRIAYAQAARNLLMYAMNQAALGHSSGLPFRDPLFATYNRGSFTGHEWPLIVDWIYNATNASGSPILTAADKATVRAVFMMWANDCMNASTTGGDHPAGPSGALNSLSLLPNNQPYRMASNNYYLAHARLLTMMSLALDPSDDPPVNAAQPSSQLGNSLRSYIQDGTGAWLYEEFAMMGDPQVVAQAYNVPNNPTGKGFGLASGGLPPEGMLYGESFAYILGQLLALQTAGFNNTAYSGPQIQLIGAPVWDRYVTGYLSSLTPAAQVFPADSWEGPLYQFAGYGDMLRLWVTPDQMSAFAMLALLDAENGNTTHLNASRWFVVNATPNGANGLLSRITNPWTWGVTESILYYLLLDPAAAAATDPRPSYPLTFYDAPAGRIVAHTDWTPGGTMFDYRASWISINHQDGEGGEFELYRKGEWLTKGMANYDNNAVGMTTTYHNSLALQNWSANGTPGLQWYETGIWANGGQWMEGMNAGDPATLFSNGAGYVYASSDLTNLFNRPDVWSPNLGATDISQATRSIVWLNNDYIVVYDRATSIHSGLFKRFNLCLINVPAINGSVTTETNPSGQQLFIQTLLPRNAAISTFNGAVNLNPIADLEPTRYNLVIQDPTNPSDTRFLHVLQGADAGASMAAATYLKSTSGTTFDGAAFAGTAVYFPVNVIAAVTATTLPAPAGVHTMLITGLPPNTGYQISAQPGSVTISPNGATTSDTAGVLKVTF